MKTQHRNLLVALSMTVGIPLMGACLTGCDKTNQAITSARSFIRMCQDSTIQVVQNTASNSVSTFSITCKTD